MALSDLMMGIPSGGTSQLPFGLDSNIFKQNGNGTFAYSSGNNTTAIPSSYFTGGMYQQDMNQYGQAMGPGGIFLQNGGTWNGSGYDGSGDASSFDPNLYTQNDQGQIVGWSGAEGTRRDNIQQAYQALLNGATGTTSFDTPGQPPQQLGTDVFTSLANGGLWMPQGSDVTGRNQNIEARVDQSSGNILVRDPRGGDGQNPLYVYGPDGKFIRQEVGSKVMSPLMGVASVGLAALGMGAMGAASGAGGLGAGMGEAGAAGAAAGGAGEAGGVASALGGSGAASGADLGAFFGGLDGSATLGGGASIAGGSALGALGGTSAAAGATSGLSSLLSNPALKGISSLTSLLGGSSSSSGGSMDTSSLGGLGALLPLLTGAIGASQQKGAANSMLDWMNGQQAKIDGLYAPGSAEYNSLWDQMSRKDAAAGRNSQYGPRSVDLAGRIAQTKADATAKLTSGLAGNYSAALNQDASSLSGLTAALGNTAQNGSLANLLKSIPGLAGLFGANSFGSAADVGQLANNPLIGQGMSPSSLFGNADDLDFFDAFSGF